MAAKPRASFVVAAIDPQESDELDISLQLSRLTAYHLIGLIETLIEHAIGIAEEVHGITPSPEIGRLRQALAALHSESVAR